MKISTGCQYVEATYTTAKT